MAKEGKEYNMASQTPRSGLNASLRRISQTTGKTLSTKNLFFAVQEWATGVDNIPEDAQALVASLPQAKSLTKKELKEVVEIKKDVKKVNFVDDLAEIPIEELQKRFELNFKSGLTSHQVEQNKLKYGLNKLDSEPPVPFWRLFLEQFEDILVIMLIGACIVSMALGQYAAGTTIVVIVMFNAILGAVQEHGAGAALDALAALQTASARVFRDGETVEIDSTHIVPGDIVMMGTGDGVTADVRLIEVQDLESNEASLTGESEAVRKVVEPAKEVKGGEEEEKLTLGNVIYMGTEITQGKGKGVVIHTGMQTKMGLLAERLKTVDAGASPLKMKLGNLGMRLGLASLSVSILIFVVGVSTGRGADPQSSDPLWLQMLLVAVSLTVAAVPEGLPVCVTLCLANGMDNMTKKQALVRKLASVETLGSTTIICTDKTGTLTCGKMTTVQLWRPGQMYKVTGQGYNPEGNIYPVNTFTDSKTSQDKAAMFQKVKESGELQPVLTAFLLCSDAAVDYEDVTIHENGVEKTIKQWVGKGNATERALVVAARKLGIERKDVESIFKEVAQNPFSSKRKMMSVLVQVSNDAKETCFSKITNNSKFVGIAKGAPNRILARATRMVVDGKVVNMGEDDKKKALKVVNHLSSKALRVLAVGVKPYTSKPNDTNDENLEKDIIFLGLNAAIDPERPEVTVAISKAANAGVLTVMITGDYLATAKAIAENIGLLDKNDPGNDERVMDCKGLRQLGADITSTKKILGDKEAKLSDAKRHEEEMKLKSLQKQVDDITVKTRVYARAEPFDKITIVESYQRQGHVACMTGDGVNDAAALQGANIGVAMGSGTDVAKGAADMVLLDDSFATIVEAIQEGRKIYANITKFVFFLLSTNVAEVFVILIAMLMGLQSPLVPIQILWLNLCTDGAPAVALALERAEPGIMDEGPRSLTEPILEKIQLTGITIQTFVETALCLVTYIVGLIWNTGSWDGQNDDKSDNELKDGIQRAQTMVIYLIVFLELLRAYTSRALRTSVFQMGVFSNKYMQYAVIVSIGATLLVGNLPVIQEIFSMKPLRGREWGLVIGLTPICSIVDELTKLVYRITGYGERPKAINAGIGAPAGEGNFLKIDVKSHGNLADQELVNRSTPTAVVPDQGSQRIARTGRSTEAGLIESEEV